MELTLVEAGVLLDALKLWETKINETFAMPESRVAERQRVKTLMNQIDSYITSGRTSF